MGEIEDLIGIYGAIDRAVAEDSERRAPVSRLLPPYRTAEVHWFDDFVAWTIEQRDDASPDPPPFPPLQAALGDLAGIEPRVRMRARRLLAVAVAVQAFPELGPDGSAAGLAHGALGVPGLAGDEDRAQRLLELLADESLLPAIDNQAPGALDAWWTNLLAVASFQGLIVDAAAMGPRPCSGRLVTVDLPGGAGPVATLETEFETDRLSFDQAIAFLEPVNWPQCSDFWCEMRKVGVQSTSLQQYHEVVSTACEHRQIAWTIEAELDFSFTRLPDVAITEYQLSAGHPLPGDDVLVDDGSLVVRRLGTGAASRLRITTTKRVKFDHPFSGEALAMIMCALGYATVAEDLVFSCAAVGGGTGGTPFPAAPLPTPVKPCVDACAPDALVQSMANMWLCAFREGAAVIDRGARNARMTARGRKPPAS